MDTLSIASANVCSQSRSGGDGVNLSKYTNVNFFFHCICIFLCVYMCAYINVFLHNLFWFCFKSEKLKTTASKTTITYHNHQTCLTLGCNSRGSNKQLGTTVPLSCPHINHTVMNHS